MKNEVNQEKTLKKSPAQTKTDLKKVPKNSANAKLKQELKSAKSKILNLELKIKNLELDNHKNMADFHAKAKGFAKKAQEEVARLRQEIHAKQAEDLKHHKKYGSQKLLEAILEPLINIELAVKAGKNNEAVKAYVIGFEMLITQLENELANFGIFKINPQLDQEFNPETMHAIKKGKVGFLVKKINKPGFMLHERVIKPAIVELD